MKTLYQIAVSNTLDDYYDELTLSCRNVNRVVGSSNFCHQVLSAMNVICRCCGASRFVGESASICCSNGSATLPTLPSMPSNIYQLWQSNAAFRKNMRKYNQVMSFCSLGANVDESLANQCQGVYTFRVNGQIHHVIGPAQAANGETPKFSQIYFLDRQSQVEQRNNVFPELDPDILGKLHDTLNEVNPYVQLYRQAHEVDSGTDYRIVFRRQNVDQRRYNEPTAAEVGCILLDNSDEEENRRDVVVRKRDGGLTYMSELHSAYDPLMYVLLLPYGSPGWHDSIPHNGSSKRITLKQFASFHLMVRQIELYPDRNPLHLGGRLFQQWVVDQYAKIESNNLRYIRSHQTTMRSECYNIAMDAVANGDVRVGKRIILPSTFIGGDRHMTQCYQDSMALVRAFGKADLFLTMTCNPKWYEIQRELLTVQAAEDRPDIVARVFNLKLNEFLDDVVKRNVLGRCIAYTYTVEFQKRGLPHAHVLLWLHAQDKPRSCDDYDKFVSAEIPDPVSQPVLYTTVSSHMLHGPCGVLNSQSSCMDCKTSKCSKNFPKPFNEQTQHNEDGYPLYRRRDNGRFVIKKVRGREIPMDNRWVVPYNPFLLAKYNCHINVEICSSVQSVKYIHKYIYKGCDRAAVRIVDGEEVIDEIDDFVEGRYISPVEACWRIFGFRMHGLSHAIIRLPVHLPNHQSVFFSDGEVLEQRDPPETKLTAYFKKCAEDEDAQALTYSEFPLHYCWLQRSKTWQRRQRQRSKTIARMYTVSMREGERFFLRLLLHRVAGATSYAYLRTFNGVVYDTFREACAARGLLEDDSTWHACMQECCQFALPYQLRQLFVSILAFSHPLNHGDLWASFQSMLNEDFRHEFPSATQEQILAHTASIIDVMLREKGMSWSAFPGLPPIPNAQPLTEASIDNGSNSLVAEELNVNVDVGELSRAIDRFNNGQKSAYDLIITAIDNPNSVEKNLFFLQGSGGTGKTFLNTALLHYVRSGGRIALAVASSGIASLLLPGGRTAHSRFKIPLNLTETSTCNIRVNSDLAVLIQRSSLILWDEAPMVHRFAFEALDRTLRDVCNDDRPMGGKVFIFSGDWRQILPVVNRGTKGATVNAALARSFLWKQVKVLKLTENMRVHADEVTFSEWLLKVGDGSHGDYPHLHIPEDIRLPNSDIRNLIDEVYPDLEHHLGDVCYLKDRVVLATTNRVVDDINNAIINRFDLTRSYHSIDSVETDDETDQTAIYPVEFLNSVSVNGLPPHHLKLAIGSMVVLLRNLDKSAGLCNGTRLIVRRLYDHILDAEVVTGDIIGRRVLIPKIRLSPSTSTLPFTLNRLQFPVKLAFAMTINKSQGQTYNRVGISLLDPVFSHGQLYVAFSRVRRKQQLSVLLPEGKTSTINTVYREVLFG